MTHLVLSSKLRNIPNATTASQGALLAALDALIAEHSPPYHRIRACKLAIVRPRMLPQKATLNLNTALSNYSESLESLGRIERTHQRLWTLALVLFVLISASLLAIEASFALAEKLLSDVRIRAQVVLNHYGSIVALLVLICLICAYFYEKLLKVRNENRDLIRALDANAKLLTLRNDQLDTWDRLSHELITNFNLPRLLELIATTAADVTDSDCAAVMVSESHGLHLRLAAIHRRGVQTDLARRIASKVIETGQPIHLQPDRVPDEFDRPDLAWEDLAAIAASPLEAQESIRGCLLVGRLTPADPYPSGVLQALQSFANQASIALEKATLYAEGQRQLQRLGKLLNELHALYPYAKTASGDIASYDSDCDAHHIAIEGTRSTVLTLKEQA